MNETKNVLIIGNGFDLALGYKTKYEDFLSFLISAKNLNFEEFVKFVKETWGIKNINNELLDYFQKRVKNEIGNNLIISYFLNYHTQTLTWADFEIELEHIGNCLESLVNGLQELDETEYLPVEIVARDDLKHYLLYLEFLKENEIFTLNYAFRTNAVENQIIYFDLSKDFKNKKISTRCNLLKFIQEIPAIFVKKLIKFASIFNDYLQIESMRKTQISKTRYSFDAIITYNYTYFCKRLVKKPFYINGKIGNFNESNLIFGVDSDVNFRTQIFDQITKRIQRASRGIRTSSISTICQDAHNLYIFGHSLTPSDKDSLQLALQQMKPRHTNKKIIIFYKSENDEQKDLITRMDLSNNLKTILDNDFDLLIDIVEFKDSREFFINN